MGDELVAYSSPWRMALLILGAILFVALGLWMVGLFGEVPQSRRWSPEIIWIIGWASILFFGAAAIFGIRRAFDRDIQLRVSDQGIYWKPWSADTIPWHEVRDVGVWEFRKQKTIILCLHHPERYPSRTLLGKLAGANRGFTGGDISISLSGMTKSFDDTFATIRRFLGVQ